MRRTTTAQKIFASLVFLLLASPGFTQAFSFAYASTWKYLNNGSNQGTTWKDPAFDDSGWPSASAQFGFGAAYTTVLGSNPTTTYFRKTVSITGVNAYTGYTLTYQRNDGVVIYVNGTELTRDNMPAGTISYNTSASSKLSAAGNSSTLTATIPASSLVEGNNVIAVEVHQHSTGAADMRFQMSLAATAITVSRGPYMQMANQSEITIKWKTSAATDSRVQAGASVGSYTVSGSDATSSTDHEIRITDLDPDTKYYYTVGTTTLALQGDANNFFTTAPPTNTTRKLRFVAFGDCGRGDATNQDASLLAYRNYLTANSIAAPDAWLLMGDNAYSAGTDAEYTSNFFNTYQGNIMKNHIVFPTPGNHDYANNSTRQVDHAVPYYTIFSNPSAAQCGGVSSGTEAYYSWDWGDVHFLALDSYGKESGGTMLADTAVGSTAQMDWIRADLAANTKKWVIAYWHHPPYTMGSHDSDAETDLGVIRQRTIKVLERLGVDLIVNGHSHVYERSYLMTGNYGLENTFSAATHAKSTSSAKYDGSASSCPYMTASGQMNKGTVYVVAGSTGSTLGTKASFPHAAMPYSLGDAGIFYFEVQGNRLDAKFIRDDGTIWDKFTIMKDVNVTSSVNITTGQSVTLNASWTGNYIWNTAATTKSITVTPAAGSTVYTVKDASSGTCITDQYTVNATGILPVSLAKYEVVLKDNKVNIDWSTATEVNSKEFVIERSVDGVRFDALLYQHASGNSSSVKTYAAKDAHPLKGVSFYRLVQKDIDGRIKQFETKKIVNNGGKSFDVKVYSNGDVVNITLVSTQKGRVTMNVYDVAGKFVESRIYEISEGSNQGQVLLSKGSYILSFNDQYGDSFVQKITVR
jgi:hypothetical protein